MEVLEADVLAVEEWRARSEAHAARVDALLAPHLQRRRDGLAHPVHDFLFTYYSHRPAQLRRWHPGFGTALRVPAGEPCEVAGTKGYAVRAAPAPLGAPGAGGTVAGVSAAHVRAQRPLLEALTRLLRATASRPPTYSCFGLHEWAMVHRSAEHGTRHDRPLRLGAEGTDAVVESQRIACSHFDAFRFFTPSARPLNTLSPGRDDRADFEQPGCLHAGMDLYKHAFRLTPMICSDLVVDAFELAWDVRILDMRAAPYDLSGLRFDHTGEEWTPVRIETPEGKREYQRLQRHHAGRAARIRQTLIEECQRLLAVATDLRRGRGA